MKKLILTTASLAAAAAFAAPAAAQDAPTGARAELLAGWDFARAEEGADFAYKNDGVLFGVGAGYDVAIGGLALGLDVEASKSDITDSVTYTDGADLVTASLDSGRDLYVGGRLTIPVGERTGVYLKAGYSNLKTKAEVSYDDGVSTYTESFSDKEDGARVGAGLQHALGAKTYVGAEYRYTNYDSDIEKHQVAATLGLRF